MATSVKVRVIESGIQSLFVDGGGVNRFGQRVSLSTTSNLRKFAIDHMRTGRLLRSFRSRSEVRRNKVRFAVTSSEPHAVYLQTGTRPHYSGALYSGVPPANDRSRTPGRSRAEANPRWHKYIGARVGITRGTRPTYFMSRALNQALRRHRLV